jgi:hypothetical protein
MGVRLRAEGIQDSIRELLVPFAHYDDPDATTGTAVPQLPPGKL